MMGIYMITNQSNNHRYIGLSVNIKRRFSEHKSQAKTGCKGLVITRAFRKHGVDCFRFGVLEVVTDRFELPERERYWISELQPEYNMNDGGLGNNAPLSDEVIEVLKEKGREQWESMSKEAQERQIRENLKGPSIGHPVSEATKQKLRQANLGKKQSAETIRKRARKLRVSLKGNKNGNKKVIRVEDDKVFNSVKEAANEVGISPGGISSVLKGHQNTSGGYTWKYFNS